MNLYAAAQQQHVLLQQNIAGLRACAQQDTEEHQSEHSRLVRLLLHCLSSVCAATVASVADRLIVG